MAIVAMVWILCGVRSSYDSRRMTIVSCSICCLVFVQEIEDVKFLWLRRAGAGGPSRPMQEDCKK